MQSIFLYILGFFARLIVQVHKPYVIWVTGTVGKTTISTSIAKYLQNIFGEDEVQISPYHYNGEFWLPLSIIGAKTWWKNPLKWFWIFCIALYRCIRPYPKYLVLEYGIDHPWEMEFLLSIVHPDIAIISPVAPNHLEQFWTIECYRREKILLTKYTKNIITHESLRPFIEKEAMFYGSWWMSEIDASHFEFSLEWVAAQVHVWKNTYQMFLPSFGAYQMENILPLYGVASVLWLDLEWISRCSDLFIPEVGRSSLLKGIENSTIIDGSYNGWFESICKGVDSILPFLPRYRVLFFLGDMRELWDHEASVHESLANYIIEKIGHEYNVAFYCVWPLMKKYVEPILQKKFTVLTSLSSRALWKDIKEILLSEKMPTIIYVKGSQNTIFLEEGIKNFLLRKEDVSLLCRQGQDWMEKKNLFFKKIQLKQENI